MTPPCDCDSAQRPWLPPAGKYLPLPWVWDTDGYLRDQGDSRVTQTELESSTAGPLLQPGISLPRACQTRRGRPCCAQRALPPSLPSRLAKGPSLEEVTPNSQGLTYSLGGCASPHPTPLGHLDGQPPRPAQLLPCLGQQPVERQELRDGGVTGHPQGLALARHTPWGAGRD